MLYLDTSVLVPLVLREATSGTIEQWFASAPARQLVTSRWTLVEFASAIGNKVRAGALSQRLGAAALDTFEAQIVAAVRLAAFDDTDLTAAARFVSRFELGLRAGDALHLAIAHRLRATRLVTLDQRMAVAARALKIDAEEPGSPA